ncbi:GTP:AMP phosphotransferase, putative [Plasmodium malariae]|uniref:GTP:AMP phosphotransferase, putative n=1 Tax=Plasmodium malariae TaxID=5858 RepID=A0A1C3KLS5_PLAMA|nr:GTP:AMP phosphotransferase, putative [Plasmodium malariae]
MKIVLFGAPGVGKGTFAEILSKKENLKHINIGNILRKEIKNNSNIGKEVNKIVKSGNLVPDSIIINIVEEEIKKCYTDERCYYKGFILDGFPRNLIQSEKLRNMTGIDIFVNIFLPKYILIQKLLGRRICSTCNSCFNVTDIRVNSYDMPPLLPSKECKICRGKANLIKRNDDTSETIAYRLNSYEASNVHVLNFFKNLNYNIVDFEIKKGVRDFDRFYNVIMKYF